jgi:choline kinase
VAPERAFLLALRAEPRSDHSQLRRHVSTQIVILAAGMGSRLGRSLPKPLTELIDGRSIMQQQFDNIHHAFGKDAIVSIVVGYKLEHIVEAFPAATFVYNEQYDQTNTSKSLMRALRASKDGGVLWMNGDVVFDPEALIRAASMVARDQSFVSVNTAKVSDEEVKYTVDADGFIDELSKTVKGGLGEAVGINYVGRNDKATLVRHLSRVADQDYFERGIELAIQQDKLRFEPVDISDLYAVEIDFAEDLERANLFV